MLAFDAGGTQIRFSLLSRNAVVKPAALPLPGSYRAFLSLLREQAGRLLGSSHCRLVIGGIAGPLNAKKSGLVQSTHLPFLIGRNLRQDITRLLKTRVFLENDNALAGLGEAAYGAGEGYRIVAYIGIGTGIGGSRCIDGRLDENAFGFEPGHHFLSMFARHGTHASPHPGDWESMVSGSGIQQRFGVRAERLKNRSAWKGLAKETAYGLVNVAVFWSPQVIIVGGSLIKTLSVAEIRRHFRHLLRVFPVRPKILRAELGNFGALWGALAFSKELGWGSERGNA